MLRRYVPLHLTERDRVLQQNMLAKSRKLYKKHQYYTRKKVDSYKYRPSKHVQNARNLYHVDTIAPTPELAKKTGCSVSALEQIVKKGEGAYYSSGSRPNQTPQSWGIARLASAITAGNAAVVDYHILKTCNPRKKAYRLATQKIKLNNKKMG